MGTPSSFEWPEGEALASQKGIQIPSMQKIPLEKHIRQSNPRIDISSAAVDLLEKMLLYDGKRRISA